nr:hypothetical protein [Marispirochaeta sp.]
MSSVTDMTGMFAGAEAFNQDCIIRPIPFTKRTLIPGVNGQFFE